MIKFYFNPAPNRPRWRSASKRWDCPTRWSRSTRARATTHAGIPGDQSQRQGAGDRRRRRNHLRQQRDPALSRREDRQVPARQVLKDRADLLSWLMFVASGIGPYSGQSVHFRNFAPEPKEYAVNRYTFEAQRHWGILERASARRTNGGRRLRHRRHGGVGLVAPDPVRAGAGGAHAAVRTCSGISARSARGRRRRERSRSRTNIPSRPRWTTRRGSPCSRI